MQNFMNTWRNIYTDGEAFAKVQRMEEDTQQESESKVMDYTEEKETSSGSEADSEADSEAESEAESVVSLYPEKGINCLELFWKCDTDRGLFSYVG